MRARLRLARIGASDPLEGTAVPADASPFRHLPDANPNPVMVVDRVGTLAYANVSSASLRETLGVGVGDAVPAGLLAEWREQAKDPRIRLEVVCPEGFRTFALTCVADDATGTLNVYGTDVTAAKVVERFPDRNPNPVLRVDRDGILIYANAASAPIVRGLLLSIGQPLPAELAARILGSRGREERGSTAPDAPDAPDAIEVRGDPGIFVLRAVDIPEFGFANIYGTDVTAARAVDAFPNLNPNPVLRVSRDGTLRYANPTSLPIREALGLRLGDRLPAQLYARVRSAARRRTPEVIEVVAGDRTFELLVASLPEFESINLYGTDVTARRLVEQTSRENERLLLNILPASIAQRLRDGEVVIADTFDEMAVLFADVVGFTSLSARMSATALVDLLNGIFTTFDRLADELGLEKIKTVGDAYMVVGGLAGDEGHTARIADMGVAMIVETGRVGRSFGLPLEIRVGLHVGPAVAGVIGIKKFIYDVWGDTVNTASRMESHGVPGRVQVTTETRDRLAATHEFERRGVVDVKGKGPLETWLLVGRRDRPRSAIRGGTRDTGSSGGVVDVEPSV